MRLQGVAWRATTVTLFTQQIACATKQLRILTAGMHPAVVLDMTDAQQAALLAAIREQIAKQARFAAIYPTLNSRKS